MLLSIFHLDILITPRDLPGPSWADLFSTFTSFVDLALLFDTLFPFQLLVELGQLPVELVSNLGQVLSKLDVFGHLITQLFGVFIIIDLVF